MARVSKGATAVSAEERAALAALRAEVDRLIREQLGYTQRDGSASYAVAGTQMGMSHNALNTVRDGGEPKVSTLLRFARHADINPLRLYALAGWFTPADLAAYVAEQPGRGVEALARDPALLARVLDESGLSAEELALLARVTRPMLELLRERRIDQARRQLAADAAPEPTADTAPPGPRARRGQQAPQA